MVIRRTSQRNKKTITNNVPLRVLHITGTMNCGGAETRLMELFKIIDRKNIQFDFCLFRKDVCYYESEIEALGGNIIRCGSPRTNFPLFAWRLYRLLKQEKYEVVHSHILLFSGIFLTIAKLAGIKKRIAHIQSTSDGKKDSFFRCICRKLLINLILRNATDIIGVSNASLRNWFGPDYMKNLKISVVHDGLDTKLFHCEPDRKWLLSEFHIPAEHKVVVHVGRFNPAKNHAKLVNVAQRYLARHPGTCFILVGDGILRREIEKSTEAKGIATKFRFVGIRSDIPRIMKSADALLFPSLWEGLPGVILEAVAAGLPMTVSERPEIREILDVCGCAEILPVDAPDTQWATALGKSVNTPHQKQWLSKFENSSFSLYNSWKNLQRIYEAD